MYQWRNNCILHLKDLWLILLSGLGSGSDGQGLFSRKRTLFHDFLYFLFSEIFQNLFIQNIKLEDILSVIFYHVRILLHQSNWWCSFLIDFFKVSEQKILDENLKKIRVKTFKFHGSFSKKLLKVENITIVEREGVYLVLKTYVKELIILLISFNVQFF